VGNGCGQLNVRCLHFSAKERLCFYSVFPLSNNSPDRSYMYKQKFAVNTGEPFKFKTVTAAVGDILY